MKDLSWFEMAPWIAIAITLILSIVIPFLTQIVNNKFQLKQQRQQRKDAQYDIKYKVFSDFTSNVGACIAHADVESVHAAGASVQCMYLFMPEENWHSLDLLYSQLRAHKWEEAEEEMKFLAKAASKLLNETQQNRKKNEKKKEESK